MTLVLCTISCSTCLAQDVPSQGLRFDSKCQIVGLLMCEGFSVPPDNAEKRTEVSCKTPVKFHLREVASCSERRAIHLHFTTTHDFSGEMRVSQVVAVASGLISHVIAESRPRGVGPESAYPHVLTSKMREVHTNEEQMRSTTSPPNHSNA